jgi:hypothetical protein
VEHVSDVESHAGIELLRLRLRRTAERAMGTIRGDVHVVGVKPGATECAFERR